ncbi:MAG TPA: serine/threonine-protein kinase [Polyangiaceae bacterium]
MVAAHADPDGEPPSGVPATLVSHRRRVAEEERRHAYQRLFLVGCVAWPAFAVHDVASAVVTDRVAALGWVECLRLLGECVALPCYLLMRSPRSSMRRIAAMDYLVFVLGGALLGLMAVRLGGLTCRYSQGVMIFVFARCTVFPLPWRRALPVPAACIAAYPLALVVATFFVPELRAQWRDRAALGVLLDSQMFVLAATAVGIFASHMIDHARRQVREARILGAYRLKVRIGRGASGDVWLARQTTLERDVALKVLRDQSWRSEEAVRRFTTEARAASRLKHPNTIRIFDFGASDDGVLFIAMELLEGLDADALVASSGPVAPARVIHLARQACASLSEAHGRGILHRDIKPANLFVAHVGGVLDMLKVLDFGVARLQGPAQAQTEEGVLFGTPDFMSPETCGGEPVDARSDVYALGASLYFMLTGSVLFPGHSVNEVIMMQVSRMPDLPSSRVAGLPADLEAVVMKCLSKAPRDRYASVDQLDAALHACADAGRWTQRDAQSWWSEWRSGAPRQQVT